MSRKRKFAPRTKSGRLSRAYKSQARDFGTPQAQRRRLGLINGSVDETLSASSIGILYANEVVDQDRYVAAQRYARSHAIIFRRTWCHAQSMLGKELPWQGVEPDEDAHDAAERRLDRWNRELTEEQRQQIIDVCCFNALPGWYLAQKLKWRALPEDETERRALVEGLEVLTKAMGIKERSRRSEATRSWSDVLNSAAEQQKDKDL